MWSNNASPSVDFRSSPRPSSPRRTRWTSSEAIKASQGVASASSTKAFSRNSASTRRCSPGVARNLACAHRTRHSTNSRNASVAFGDSASGVSRGSAAFRGRSARSSFSASNSAYRGSRKNVSAASAAAVVATEGSGSGGVGDWLERASTGYRLVSVSCVIRLSSANQAGLIARAICATVRSAPHTPRRRANATKPGTESDDGSGKNSAALGGLLETALLYAARSSDMDRSRTLFSASVAAARAATSVSEISSSRSCTSRFRNVVGANGGSPGATTGRSRSNAPRNALPSSNAYTPKPCFWSSKKSPTYFAPSAYLNTPWPCLLPSTKAPTYVFAEALNRDTETPSFFSSRNQTCAPRPCAFPSFHSPLYISFLPSPTHRIVPRPCFESRNHSPSYVSPFGYRKTPRPCFASLNHSPS